MVSREAIWPTPMAACHPPDTVRPGWGIALGGIAVTLLAVSGSGCHLAAGGNNIEGVSLYQQGQHQAALQKFQEAVRQDPTNADAYYNLAAVTHELGYRQQNAPMLEQAERLYRRCLENDPEHVDCHRGLAVLLVRRERSQEAFSLLEGWARQQPAQANPHVEIARLYEEFGELELATQHLQEAVALDVENARAWRALGAVRERTGNTAQALADYQRSLKLDGFQTELAARVAELRRNVYAGGLTTQGGTRMVTTHGQPTTR